MRSILTALSVLALIFLGTATTVFGQDKATAVRTVTVRGDATHHVPPDQAVVMFSIVTRGKDPNLARKLNADAGARAIHSIESAGIPSKSIRLQNLVLTPARKWNGDTREWEELGYDVTRSVQVVVDDLELVADVVTRGVESGVNRLDGVQYGLKSETAVRTRVLADAVAAAKTRASTMVDVLGIGLGPVLTISEEGISVPAPYVQAERFQLQKAMSDESAALPAGDIEVSAAVSVTFAIN